MSDFMLETDLRNKYKDSIEYLDIFPPKHGAFELKLIEVKKEKRGTGVGTKIMRDICDYADSNGYIIVLSPSEIKTSKLIKWYKGFDFLENKGRNKDFRFWSRMIRYPLGLTRSKWIDKYPAEAEQTVSWKPKNIGNPKFMTLEQLERIANDPYFRGVDGADYEVIREEIQERLWKLQNDKTEKDLNKRFQELEEYEEMLKATGNSMQSKHGVKAMRELELLTKNGIKIKNGKIAKSDMDRAIALLCNTKASADFKTGDLVIVDDKKKGKVIKIHSMGDMADVDFGNGDIHGIMFNRMKLDSAKACMNELMLEGKELKAKKTDKLIIDSKKDSTMKKLTDTKEVLDDELSKIYATAKLKEVINLAVVNRSASTVEIKANLELNISPLDFSLFKGELESLVKKFSQNYMEDKAESAVVSNNKIRFEAIGGGVEVYSTDHDLRLGKIAKIGLNGFGSGSIDYVAPAWGDTEDMNNISKDIINELHQIYNEADKAVTKMMLSYNFAKVSSQAKADIKYDGVESSLEDIKFDITIPVVIKSN